MEVIKERKFECRFCYKKFPSGKSLGGHIRIHSNENSVDSDRYYGNKNKRLVDQREMMATKQQQLCCTECGKRFVSLEALCAHMTNHSRGEKMLMDSQSDTETSSAPTTRKRSKRVMRQSDSESFSNGSSSFASEIDQQDKDGAFNLMMMLNDSSSKKGRNLVVNSLGESSENNSVILETKSSSREELKMFNVNHQVLETDKVAVDDQLRSADDNGVVLCDSDRSDSDYFMNGPMKSDSDISVDGSLRNTGCGSGFNNSLNRFRNSDEGRSKYELSKSKRVSFRSYETDSFAHTNRKIHRSRDSKTPMVKKTSGEKKKSKGHECPICFRVFKTGQALGGHKRSHSIAANQEHMIEHQEAEMRNSIDLNLPASDIDE